MAQRLVAHDEFTRLAGRVAHVVEIGAGRGALTRALAATIERTKSAETSGRLLAIEIDPYLAANLRRDFPVADVVCGDFLDWQVPLGWGAETYALIGNIPFALSSDIVRHIATLSPLPTDAFLIVQREFAYRLCGRPFGRETRLSLQLKPHWHIELIDSLRRVDFDPPPRVDSVFVRLARRDRPLIEVDELASYRALLAALVDQQAPVGAALKHWCSKREIRRLGRDYCFPLDAPVATLSFEHWLGIHRFVSRLPPRRSDRRGY